MAERIIAADPFGLMRYGETAALTPHLADRLFEALSALAEIDPYFRASDWESKTAAGLMIRPDLVSANPFVDLRLNADGTAELDWRATANGAVQASETATAGTSTFLRLVRDGNSFAHHSAGLPGLWGERADGDRVQLHLQVDAIHQRPRQLAAIPQLGLSRTHTIFRFGRCARARVGRQHQLKPGRITRHPGTTGQPNLTILQRST